jgi:hypothetical protein
VVTIGRLIVHPSHGAEALIWTTWEYAKPELFVVRAVRSAPINYHHCTLSNASL